MSSTSSEVFRKAKVPFPAFSSKSIYGPWSAGRGRNKSADHSSVEEALKRRKNDSSVNGTGRTTALTYQRCQDVLVVGAQHVLLGQSFGLEDVEIPRCVCHHVLGNSQLGPGHVMLLTSSRVHIFIFRLSIISQS